MTKIPVMKDRPRVLNYRQRLFVENFVSQGFKDATAALVKAGYSVDATKGTKNKQAFLTIRRPEIKRAIDEALEKRLQEEGLTKYDLVRTMLAIAMFDPSKVMEWDDTGIKRIVPSEDIDPFTRRAVSRIKQTSRVDREGNAFNTLEFTFVDKVPILNTLMEHLGLKESKVFDGAPNGVTIVIHNRIAEIPIGPDAA